METEGGGICEKAPVLCYMICYTGGFLVLVVIVFSTMILSNKALVWKIDAMPQYFPYLKYMAKFLRESVVSMLHGDFNLKMYDFTIGMGGRPSFCCKNISNEFPWGIRTRPLYGSFL